MTEAEPRISAGFKAAAAAIADAIGDCDFSLRERCILELIRRRSFGAGRTEAYVPKLEFFDDAFGITKGNAHEILKKLKRCLVIEEQPEGFYGFILPVSGWRVPLRFEVIKVMEQLALLEEPEHLRGALRETFVATHATFDNTAVLPTHTGETSSVRPDRSQPTNDVSLVQQGGSYRESAGSVQSGDRAAMQGAPGVIRAKVTPSPVIMSTPVPESGTTSTEPQDVFSGSVIGNVMPQSPQKPGPARALPQVPKSGTETRQDLEPRAKAQVCTKAPSLKTDKPASLPVAATKLPAEVPESGTGKLDLFRQELMDALEKVRAFGPNDESKGNWMAMVRKRPLVVERLLGELKYRMQQPHLEPVQKPGAWMNKEWDRWGRPNT